MSVLPELSKLISGNDNHYPNLGSGASGSGNSGSGSGNGYRVFCPSFCNENLIVWHSEDSSSRANIDLEPLHTQ
jgi:hypothetical protein